MCCLHWDPVVSGIVSVHKIKLQLNIENYFLFLIQKKISLKQKMNEFSVFISENTILERKFSRLTCIELNEWRCSRHRQYLYSRSVFCYFSIFFFLLIKDIQIDNILPFYSVLFFSSSVNAVQPMSSILNMHFIFRFSRHITIKVNFFLFFIHYSSSINGDRKVRIEKYM